MAFGNNPMTASEVTLLPQPELADQAEGAAAHQRQVDTVDRPGGPSAIAVEHDLEVLDRQQRLAGGHRPSPAAIALAMAASMTARSVSPTGLRRLGMNCRKWT